MRYGASMPRRLTLSRFLPDWFLAGMVLAMLLAWLFPGPGASGGWLHPDILTKAGIALIFFLHGLLLSFGALRAGLYQWKAHLLIQGTTFLVFPLIGLAVLVASRGVVDPVLALGFFYLCALPSTVSSSVAMTAAAKGDVPVAVFNATLSSLLGVVLTPLWIGMAAEQAGEAMKLGEVILDLVLLLLLPLAVGQMLRRWLGAFALRHKRWVSKVDRGVILLLVYTSFCDSFAMGVWEAHDRMTLGLTLLATAALFFAVLGTMILLCRGLGVQPAQRSAVVFCGSKKSLATGVPMAHLIFAGNPQLGVILLPILLYHPLQLLVCAPLANAWARRTPSPADGPGATLA